MKLRDNEYFEMKRRYLPTCCPKCCPKVVPEKASHYDLLVAYMSGWQFRPYEHPNPKFKGVFGWKGFCFTCMLAAEFRRKNHLFSKLPKNKYNGGEILFKFGPSIEDFEVV